LFSQSLTQIDALLPEANIRDLLAIAKESINLMVKLSEMESTTSNVKPAINTGLLEDFRKKIDENTFKNYSG
jgi:hypothetical protein